MQILNVEVLAGTSVSDVPIVRVVFHGEGDDRITVDIAGHAGHSLSDDGEAIARARAALAQAATVDVAVNAYDALSNGNFDEAGIERPGADEGGNFIFEYRDGDGARQIPLSSMPSHKAARQEAVRCAIDLLHDLEPGLDSLSGWLVRVRDEAGVLLFTIDVHEAELARQEADGRVGRMGVA